jgi:hypothetical protein
MVRGPKYDGKYLHALLRQYLGDMRLDKALTSLIIPTFDIAYMHPTIFSSFEVNLMCPPVYWQYYSTPTMNLAHHHQRISPISHLRLRNNPTLILRLFGQVVT